MHDDTTSNPCTHPDGCDRSSRNKGPGLCHKHHIAERAKITQAEFDKNPYTEKLCKRCDTVKPLSEFHKDSTSRDRHSTYCKLCNNAATQARLDKIGPEGRKALSEYKTEYNRQNHEKYMGWARTYRSKDPEKHKQEQAEWRANNPEQLRVYHMRRRAAKLGGEVCEDVERLVVADNYDWICQWCFRFIDPEATHRLEDGSLNPWYLHIDHRIPLSKGGEHSYANTQPMHATCNLSKSASIQEDGLAV